VVERADAKLVGMGDCWNNPFTHWGVSDDDDTGNPIVRNARTAVMR